MKDPGYQRIKQLLEGNHLTHLSDITEIVSKRQLCKDIHMGFVAFTKRLQNPDHFTLGEIKRLAKLVDTDPEKIFALALKKKAK